MAGLRLTGLMVLPPFFDDPRAPGRISPGPGSCATGWRAAWNPAAPAVHGHERGFRGGRGGRGHAVRIGTRIFGARRRRQRVKGGEGMDRPPSWA
jgi:hypothetical protein